MPRVRVGIYIPQISNRWAVVDFIIDTGCTVTTLHPLDAMSKIGISQAALADPAKWPSQVPTSGTGGATTNYSVPAVYLFLHDDGRPETIHGELLIAQFTAGNALLPSLLGLNVLQHFRLTADPSGKTVILEK